MGIARIVHARQSPSNPPSPDYTNKSHSLIREALISKVLEIDQVDPGDQHDKDHHKDGDDDYGGVHFFVEVQGFSFD